MTAQPTSGAPTSPLDWAGGTLNPFAGLYLSEPAIVWRDLLDHPGPVYADDLGLWLISHHADVRRALGDPDTFSNAMTLAPVYDLCPEALAIVMQIDAPPVTAAAAAPTHTRTRRALRVAFANTAPRVDEWYGPIVARRVDELVGKLAARQGETVDLVADFCSVLPVQMICDILGVPEAAVPDIKRWADGQIALVWGNPSDREQVRLARGLLAFWQYCRGLVDERADQHDDGHTYGDDFIDRALAYRDGDDAVLTEAEVASLAFNLLVAGHETTAGLLAHALDQALTEPDRWQRLVEDPASVPAFVEETLRYGPAIDAWLRLTTRDVTIGGVTIPAGARCLLMLGAANRDRTVFDQPDEFDPDRGDTAGHLTFGYGPHYCIGAGLARLEATTALQRLAADVPRLRLAPDYQRQFKPNVAFRAHTSLRAVVCPA